MLRELTKTFGKNGRKDSIMRTSIENGKRTIELLTPMVNPCAHLEYVRVLPLFQKIIKFFFVPYAVRHYFQNSSLAYETFSSNQLSGTATLDNHSINRRKALAELKVLRSSVTTSGSFSSRNDSVITRSISSFIPLIRWPSFRILS